MAFSTGATKTVNGVAFTTSTTQNGITFNEDDTFTIGGTSYTGFNMGNTQFGPAAGGNISSDYAGLLKYCHFSDVTDARYFALSGLTAGQQYQVQLWVCDYRNFPNDRTETISGVDAGNSPSAALKFLDSDLSNTPGAAHGQYILGQFTADSTGYQVFAITGNEEALLNAIQVRTVPEPSTLALLSAGLLGLLAYAWRKHK